MRIIDYPISESLAEDNVLVIDGASGTKSIKTIDSLGMLLDQLSVNNHKIIFRGANLGSTLTAEQKSSIQSGTFKNIYLGDYWTIGGINWRIVDFDYWYGKGDSELVDHHLIIMPDTNLEVAKMNTTDTTTGGYIGSQMYTTNISNAKNTINSAFGSNVLKHREYLTNSVTDGIPTDGTWTDSAIDLPNEPMIYGSYICTPGSTGSVTAKRYAANNTQLALFRTIPHFINKPDGSASRISYWLRDVASSTSFVCANANGSPEDATASQEYGIRPVFAIG